MADTPEEIAARRQQSARYYAQRVNQSTPNPLYGVNPFNPESYLPTTPDAASVAADARLATPVPQGRQVDNDMPSELNIARLQDVPEFRANPQKYLAEHATQQVEEESLLDKGKSMLGKLFDFKDEADLSLFGVNLSAVESIWDGAIRHITGAYDVVNVGLGWAVSAMPGGVQTLDGGQLSGEKTFLQVLNGEMEPGDAPSPGQIAIASIALESKRIREGGARLTDVLLLNPATAPFILAGIAADTSPLQKDGFDLLNKEQRDTAFGSGWEQWMSGITDAGLAFADPAIAAGVGAKVARLGLLGARGTAKDLSYLQQSLHGAYAEIDAHIGQARNVDSYLRDADSIASAKFAAATDGGNVVSKVSSGGDIAIAQARDIKFQMLEITDDMAKPVNGFQNPLSDVLWDISVKSKATGEKVMSVEEIMKRREIRSLRNRPAAASLLHDADTPLLVNLVFQSMSGTPGAKNMLQRVAPALADETARYARENVTALSFVQEGMKQSEAVNTLKKMESNLTTQYDMLKDQIRHLEVDARGQLVVKESTSAADIKLFNQNKQRMAVLEQSRDEVLEMKNIIEGTPTDMLDPTGALYRSEEAQRVIADLHTRNDVVTRALNDDIFEAAREARMWLPGKDNWYARKVMNSRARAARAAYEYSVEGSGIFPKKRIEATTIDEFGNVTHTYKNDGWFSSSQFGTHPIKRAARVWRWLGTETPSGYIALKGGSSVGSEREFMAAIDLDLYKGDGVLVRRTGSNGEIAETIVGGAAKKQEYTERFMRAMSDDTQDAFTELSRVEQDIMNDLAAVYNMNPDHFSDLLNKANRSRAESLRVLREGGYVVDDKGNRHYAPFLQQHLANGTYMQNFRDFEKKLQGFARKEDGIEKLRSAFEAPLSMSGNAYEVFNSFWRPMTLLRLGYTQRNVFEGMVRAMAYSSSLVPLTWPARAAYYGVRNKAVSSVVARRAEKAAKALPDSSYQKQWDAYAQAAQRRQRLSSAYQVTEEAGKDPVRYVFSHQLEGNKTVYTRMTEGAYQAKLKAAEVREIEALADVRMAVGQFDDAVKGTKFGEWRAKQIAGLEDEIKALKSQQDDIMDLHRQMCNLGLTGPILEDATFIDQLGQLSELIVYQERMYDNIAFHPTLSLAEYKGQAGRQKRIGSGTSLGPDGNKYSNAWDGPLAQINWGNMSADATTKQRTQLIADIYHGLLTSATVRPKQAIAFNPAKMEPWLDGMADTIEGWAASPVAQHLVLHDYDVSATVRWLMNDPQGRKVASDTAHLFPGDRYTPMRPEQARVLRSEQGSTKTVMVDGQIVSESRPFVKVTSKAGKEEERLAPFMSQERYLSGGKQMEFDPDAIHEYVALVSNEIMSTMQDVPDFYALLRNRVEQNSGRIGDRAVGGMNASSFTPTPVGRDDIASIVNRMDGNAQANLGYVAGNEIIEQGTKRGIEIYRTVVNRLFKVLGTIPEDAVVRGPFYQMRFKQTRNSMIRSYWERTNPAALTRGGRKAKASGSGATQELTLTHPEFTIPERELNRIIEQSHRQALLDTKEWMYTIDRRTNLGKYGEWIFPFISATQNSVTVGGKLLFKEPWLMPFVYDLWRMPQRAGFEDEEGNLRLVIPQNWITDALKNNPDIPFFGGVIDDTNSVIIPKNGINVFMPETGFGYAPTPAPLIQVSASELMKANILPVETPEALKGMFGDQAAGDMWQGFKDYMFGEDRGLSSAPGSFDLYTPAWFQRFLGSKNELSSDYGYQYTLQYQTQMARYMAGERDDRPTESEINKRTTNMFLFNMLGNLGIPTPYTPYPILTRPQVRNEGVQLLVDTLQAYRKADPQNAAANFQRDFGDWALQMANTKVTLNAGGANLNPETSADIQTFDSLLRNVSGDVGDNTEVLGILVNNRGDQSSYDPVSYEYQKSKTIPGTSQPWRKVLSPEEAVNERQRVAGWTTYRRFMDNLDARLHNAGFKSYESAGAQQFKAAKNQFVANMLNNVEYRGWAIDYQDRAGDRTIAAVRVMTGALQDPTFVNKMTEWGKANTLSAMSQYIFYRNGLLESLRRSGRGIDAEENAALKVAWAVIRQNLRNSDVRWAEISDLYLNGDDDPTRPGQFAFMEGVA